ncbi:MAG: hypothetical protein ABIS27_08870 [Longimicrobiales bacterium]
MSPTLLPAELMEWLDSRTPQPPAALREKLVELLAAHCSTTEGAIASTLGEAAITALAKAIEKCDDRSSAMDLLAADALLTYAMEAAAEQGSAAVHAVALAYGNHRLAALVTGVQ